MYCLDNGFFGRLGQVASSSLIGDRASWVTAGGIVLGIMMFVSLLGYGTEGQAAERVRDMGSVRLWTESRSAHQSNDVLSQALEQVIIRISGQANSLSLKPVQKWLRRPADYLVSYVYEQPSRVEMNDRNLQGLATNGMWLKLIFDHQALSQAMRELGVPVWGESRPRVVVWWGIEADGQRYLLGRQDETPVTRAFERASTSRGVPIVLPKVDAEDLSRVGHEGVFGFAADPILQGSKRYAADAILAGRVKKRGASRWEASWQLYVNGESYWFEDTAESVTVLAERALDSLAEQLSAVYAVTTSFGEPGQVGVRIIDVNAYRTYVAIQRYLERLNVVNKVHLSQVRGAQLQYQIHLDGDIQQFKKALSLGGKLVETGNTPAPWSLPITPKASNTPAADGAWGMQGAPTQNGQFGRPDGAANGQPLNAQGLNAGVGAGQAAANQSLAGASGAAPAGQGQALAGQSVGGVHQQTGANAQSSVTANFPQAQLEYYWVGSN